MSSIGRSGVPGSLRQVKVEHVEHGLIIDVPELVRKLADRLIEAGVLAGVAPAFVVLVAKLTYPFVHLFKLLAKSVAFGVNRLVKPVVVRLDRRRDRLEVRLGMQRRQRV